jgi:hypothetical protein
MEKWSMSDIDGFLQMYHAGELTKHETEMLEAILRRLGWSNLLNRKSYETAVA